MKVVGVQRLKSRITGKPGLVKINLSNLEEQKWYCERKVKEVEQYKKVFLRRSKSHTDRILQLKARTLLDEVPHGDRFREMSNGRIVKKTQLTRPHGRINENTTRKQPNERSSLNAKTNTRPIGTISIGHINVCGWTKSNHDLRR